MTRSGRRGPHLVQFDEPRPTQLFDVDGGLIFCSSQRRDRPRGFQEFTASPDQIRGAVRTFSGSHTNTGVPSGS